MKKTNIFLLLMFWCAGCLILTAAGAKKTVVPLPDLINPKSINADDTQFYFSEEATVYIYKLDGYRFLKKFGSSGEGPQQFKTSRLAPIITVVKHDKLLIYSFNKISEFTKDGSFIKEIRLSSLVNKGYSSSFYKLGEFYIHCDIAPGSENFSLLSYYLCNSNFEQIRELTKLTFPIDPWKKEWHFFCQSLPPRFYKNMAFLAVGDNLKIIGVNDAGKIFLNLEYEYERIQVTKDHINAIHEYFKTVHSDKARYESRKSWFRFPEYFPAIKDFQVEDDLIFIQTYKLNKEKQTEFLIFNLKGKFLRSVYLPVVAVDIETDYPYLIKNGKFFQLVDNVDDENWYLHITPID